MAYIPSGKDGESELYVAGKKQTPRTPRQDAQPGDELVGYWSQKQLVAMNERFCARVTDALALEQERDGDDPRPTTIVDQNRRIRLTRQS